MATITFHELNLVARDIEATLAFYRRLGLEIPDDALWRTPSGVHHVKITLGGAHGFALDSEPLASAYNAGYADTGEARTVISFRLDSRDAVDATYAELTGAGARGLQEPYDVFWGARYAIVEDPDGRHVGFMSPSDPARRTAPPKL